MAVILRLWRCYIDYSFEGCDTQERRADNTKLEYDDDNDDDGDDDDGDGKRQPPTPHAR